MQAYLLFYLIYQITAGHIKSTIEGFTVFVYFFINVARFDGQVILS